MGEDVEVEIERIVGGKLEYPCDLCGRTGRWKEAGEYGRCWQCDGAGYIPTDLGNHVLRLIRHNLGPMLDDLESER